MTGPGKGDAAQFAADDHMIVIGLNRALQAGGEVGNRQGGIIGGGVSDGMITVI